MPKLGTYAITSVGWTPQDVRRMRQQVYDYHLKEGRAYVHKHRWNPIDERAGKAIRCPFHDPQYNRDLTNCPYCFGTGYLGGFDDGNITFMTLSDAPQDLLRISREGIITPNIHPQLTAPWYPDLGDGDMIIAGEFDSDNWDIITETGRFELNEVTPTTVRGFPGQYQPTEYKIQQTAQIDRLPYGHIYYDVPIVFDYGGVPIAPIPGVTPGSIITSRIVFFRMSGAESGLLSTIEAVLMMDTLGTPSTLSTQLRITAHDAGTVIVWESD